MQDNKLNSVEKPIKHDMRPNSVERLSSFEESSKPSKRGMRLSNVEQAKNAIIYKTA